MPALTIAPWSYCVSSLKGMRVLPQPLRPLAPRSHPHAQSSGGVVRLRRLLCSAYFEKSGAAMPVTYRTLDVLRLLCPAATDRSALGEVCKMAPRPSLGLFSSPCFRNLTNP